MTIALSIGLIIIVGSLVFGAAIQSYNLYKNEK